MSMTLLVLQPDSIRVLTDTLVMRGGAPDSFTSKVDVLDKAVLFTRGAVAVGDAIRSAVTAYDLDTIEPDFGRFVLAECVAFDKHATARVLHECERRRAQGIGELPSGLCEALLVGWSERHGRFRAIFTDPTDVIGNVTAIPDGFSIFPSKRHLDNPYQTLPSNEQLVLIADNLDLRARVEEKVILYGGEMMLTTIDRDGVRTECIGRFHTYADDAAAIAQRARQEAA